MAYFKNNEPDPEEFYSAEENADRYSRIDMAARNVADRISHCNNDQTKSKSCHKVCSVSNRAVAADRNSCAAAKQHKHESTQTFRQTFLE